jgi:hypothetical protein
VFKCERNRGQHFKTRHVRSPQQQNAGRVVRNQGNTFSDEKGFTTQDILWAIGVWSVILTLSQVVVFSLLMVN